MVSRFTLLIVLCLAYATVVNASLKPNFDPLSDDLIRYVNEESGAHWKAARSKKFGSLQEARKLLGALRENPRDRQTRRPTVRHDNLNDPLPKVFDAREKWPNCPSIPEIRDQSSCGSCWAFGAVEAMSDRMCIHTDGNFTADLSARDLLSCCGWCGYGCEGGYPSAAWDYWKTSGIVTGGSKEQGTGCEPYPFPTCSHHGRGNKTECPADLYSTPKCLRTCAKTYHKSYAQDKTYAVSSYNVDPIEKNIMKEIMMNGPVEADFEVFEDFLNYESGIYHHVYGNYQGGHAIRILGWGEENGVPYWLIANSWNEDWGENGYFRMLRGENECEIESDVVAGMPLVK